MKALLNPTFDMADNIKYKAKQHWIIYILPSIYSTIGLLGLVPIVLGAGSFATVIGIALCALLYKGLSSLLRIVSTSIYLTEEYLTISQGILGKTVLDISLKKLEGIQMHQSLVGRLLGYGLLIVSTGEVAQQYLVKEPKVLRDKILNK